MARPPPSLWFAPVLVALLRAGPWLDTLGAPVTGTGVLPPIGYNPKDWLAYVAFIREAAAGHWLLANPFTTAPQDGRYLLLLQSALGLVVRGTGLDPFTVLELSRIPLLFLLLSACWRVTGIVLADDRRARVLACWLVMLAGGLEVVIDEVQVYLPEQVRWQVNQDLWHLQGWNTFAASYNPLWVAGLALTLVTLVPLLRPGGPRGVRDAAMLGGGFLALAWLHPYSAIVVATVAVVRPLLGWLVGMPAAGAGMVVAMAGLLPASAVVAAVAAWQSGDAVYRATSDNVLGAQALTVFWYPVTLGAVGVLAVRGWGHWLRDLHPCRLGMGAWTLAVIFLHTSTVLNGYHFVFHLFPPVCIAAAPALVRTLDRLRARPFGVAAMVGLAVLIFQAPFTLTRKCLAEVETHRIRETGAQVLRVLAGLPPGNVLAPADLGNFVPAFTPHRVYVGHWFLTPQYQQRAAEARALASGQATVESMTRLVDGERIRYLVAAAPAVAGLTTALGARVARTLPAGDLVILVLDGPGSAALGE